MIPSATSANSKRSPREGCLFVTYILCGSSCFVIGLLLSICLIFVVIFYDTLRGNTRFGAEIYCQNAMDRGDGKSAVRFGEELWKYRNEAQGDDYVRRLAVAYELNKEYDKALKAFAQFKGKKYAACMGVARIYYKQGKRQEAFIEYCSNLDEPEYQRDKDMSTLIYWAVMCEHLGNARVHMCPFETYEQFNAFMAEEYQKLGCPEKYACAVEMFEKGAPLRWER